MQMISQLVVAEVIRVITMREILFLLIPLCCISCGTSDRRLPLVQSDYKGEKFPKQYFVPEDTIPTVSDLEYYITTLQRTLTYFYKELKFTNDTEVNRALGIFLTKAVLKKSIRDYGDKLSKSQSSIIRDLIYKGEDYTSHYIYIVKLIADNKDIEYRVTGMLRDDTIPIYSMGNFNRGRLSKWILSNISMHSYVEAMDNITLPREKYGYICESMESFYINMIESDTCLSHVMFNPEPIDLSELRPCLPDPYCQKPMLSPPSAAYALSHRLLNIMVRHHTRRCYVQTEQEDVDMMDSLCAFMYREAVYLARRGYFARDLFLEHIALCGLLGYEEFFRRRWFQKASSWVDDQGCIKESNNFIMNRSRLYNKDTINVRKRRKILRKFKISLLEDCHSHPMALLSVVLAHAIRHTLHFMVG